MCNMKCGPIYTNSWCKYYYFVKNNFGTGTVVLQSSVHLFCHLQQKVFNAEKNHLYQHSSAVCSSGDCGVCTCNIPADKNNFAIIYLVLPSAVPRYRKHFHWDSNPGYSRFLKYVPVILPEQKMLVFTCILLSSLVFKVRENPSLRLEPGTIFGFVTFLFL
jgi:hypothetical protein